MDEAEEMHRRQTLDQIVYWNHFDPSKHHFFKIMKFFRDELRLPRKFVMRFPIELKTVKLKGPLGDERGVRVMEAEEDIVLREGWAEFVEDHHLEEEDLVVFHYIGNKTFEVFMFDRTGCEKDLRVIEDQHEIKPHFFKRMTVDIMSKLLIPRKLVTIFPEKLAGTISLKGPSGNVWKVRADWSDPEDVFLGKGWSDFVSDHSLNVFDLLVFRYTQNSSFDVLVFDRSGCERESLHFVKPKLNVQQTNVPGGSRTKGKAKRLSEDDHDNEFHVIENQWNLNPEKKGKMSVNQKRRLPKDVTEAELNEMKLNLKRTKK